MARLESFASGLVAEGATRAEYRWRRLVRLPPAGLAWIPVLMALSGCGLDLPVNAFGWTADEDPPGDPGVCVAEGHHWGFVRPVSCGAGFDPNYDPCSQSACTCGAAVFGCCHSGRVSACNPTGIGWRDGSPPPEPPPPEVENDSGVSPDAGCPDGPNAGGGEAASGSCARCPTLKQPFGDPSGNPGEDGSNWSNEIVFGTEPNAALTFDIVIDDVDPDVQFDWSEVPSLRVSGTQPQLHPIQREPGPDGRPDSRVRRAVTYAPIPDRNESFGPYTFRICPLNLPDCGCLTVNVGKRPVSPRRRVGA